MERLVMDPAEFIENRTELSLSGLGLEVVQAGVDWGESQVELQLARQQIGESAINRHLTNVAMTIPLRVQKESGVKLAEAAYKLQQKVGLWQQEGGWLLRTFDVEGKFAGSVGYQIIGASLSGLQGWMFAHRQTAPEVSLKLLRGPLCYSTTEIEGTEVKGSEVRDLQWELPEVKGTAPGLLNLRVKNEGATDWRGLISSIESRDYSSAETALPVYEAEKLTLKGGATEAERTGASGKVVRSAALSFGWQTVLGSEIAGVGHMTHVGVRRMRARVFDPSSSVGGVQLRLLWRSLGSPVWSENELVSSPVVGAFQIVDLGECRPQTAVIGLQRWEWKLQARAPGGSGTIDVDRIWPSAAEQIVVLSEAEADPIDGEPTKAPGTVEDNATTGTVAWSNVNNVKVEDGACAVAEGSKTESTTTHYLRCTNLGFAIPEGSTIKGIIATVRRQIAKPIITEGTPAVDARVRIIKAGTIKETEDKASASAWPEAFGSQVYGGAGDLWGNTWAASDINNSGFGLALSVKLGKNISSFALKAEVDSVKVTVVYTESTSETRVCFATRSVALKGEGCFRQALTSEVWGQLIPESGSNPYAPQSGLENRKARGILIPTQGDLAARADANANKISVKPSYRPAYHFAREST